MKKRSLSLILPCYNEAEHFRKSADWILNVLENCGTQFEIIFVEDCSKDNTKQIIENYLKNKKDDSLKVFYHNDNQGRGKTVCDGILKAKGDYVGFMDIDCEISPEYIPAFLNRLNEGYAVVNAERFYPVSAQSILRAMVSKLYSFLVRWILKTNFTDTEAGFKFFNRKIILPLVHMTQDPGWFWDTEIMLLSQRLGLKISFISVLFKRRTDKTSTVKLWSDSFDYFKKLLEFKVKLKSIKS